MALTETRKLSVIYNQFRWMGFSVGITLARDLFCWGTFTPPSGGPLRAAAAGWGHVLTATVDGKVLETDHAVAPIASSQRYSCGTMHEWPVPLSDKLPRPQREVVQQDLSGLCPAVSTRGDHGSHAGPQLRQGDSQPLPIGPSGGSSPPVHDPSPQGTRPSTGTPEGLTRTSEPELPSSSPSFQGAPCEPCDGDFQAPQPRDREYGRQREEEGRPRNVWCRIPFPPGLRVVAVAAGELHSLCLSEEGSVWAWGSNGEGQLGTDSRVSSGEASSATLQISPRCVLGPLAAEVDRQAPVRSIACGARHNLALMRDGQVYCWGWALHGQCGPGPSETAAVQHKAVQNEAVQHEAIHSYIVDNFLETEEGARLCGTPLRGVGDEGEGHEPERKRAKVNGGTVRYESASQPLPCMPVPCCVAQLSGLDVCGVAAGLAHSAVCTESGAVYCWGWNSEGQLGLGHKQSSCLPQLVEEALLDQEHIVKVCCGARHTLVLTQSGKAFAWGWGGYGQLGLPPDTISFHILSPALVPVRQVHTSSLPCGAQDTPGLERPLSEPMHIDMPTLSGTTLPEAQRGELSPNRYRGLEGPGGEIPDTRRGTPILSRDRVPPYVEAPAGGLPQARRTEPVSNQDQVPGCLEAPVGVDPEARGGEGALKTGVVGDPMFRPLEGAPSPTVSAGTTGHVAGRCTSALDARGALASHRSGWCRPDGGDGVDNPLRFIVSDLACGWWHSVFLLNPCGVDHD
eukprot:jgi/Botrbrau1/9769/Bobra.85_1s0017.2